MKRSHYQTAGRRALTDFLEANPDRQFTAEEIYSAVNTRTPVGKSSVYRQLAELCEHDALRKFRNDERGCSVYQYVGASCDCREHFHEKCVMCGKLRHLDCHATADFIRHLEVEHGFSVHCGESILYGVCAECREKGGEAHA